MQVGDDESAAGYLRRHAFQPSFSFENPWKVSQDLLVPWSQLKARIPRRIDEIRTALRGEVRLSG